MVDLHDSPGAIGHGSERRRNYRRRIRGMLPYAERCEEEKTRRWRSACRIRKSCSRRSSSRCSGMSRIENDNQGHVNPLDRVKQGGKRTSWSIGITATRVWPMKLSFFATAACCVLFERLLRCVVSNSSSQSFSLFASAQKTVASLGDPCDCHQNHDYWQTMLDTMLTHLQPDLNTALFVTGSASQAFFSKQSCIWSSTNEESHRLAALSDCIPGFVTMKISCVQHLIWSAFDEISASTEPENNDDPHFIAAKEYVELALGHMAEIIRTAVFGKECIDPSVWPVTMNDITSNYIRFYRTHSYYRVTERMLAALVWTSGTCQTTRDCVGGNVAGKTCKNGRCVQRDPPLSAADLDAFALDPVRHFCVQPNSFHDADGNCWHMGKQGASCRETCEALGTVPAKDYKPRKDRMMTTPLLTEKNEAVVILLMNDPWMEQECYVRSQSRFHPAVELPPEFREAYNISDREDWKDELCHLSCQCEKIPVRKSQTGSLKARQWGDCVYEVENMCVTNGTFYQSINYNEPQAFEDGGMFRACSEVGQTLFQFDTSARLFPPHPFGPVIGDNSKEERVAFIVPVTFKLTSTWHGIHSLIPPFVMLYYPEVIEKYALQQGRNVDLFLVNQNLERDVEHWNKLLGYDTMKFDGKYGWFSNFLDGFANVDIYSQGYQAIDRCYRRIVFGHELLMYSGGGWVEPEHVQFFTRKMRNYFLGGERLRKRAKLSASGKDPDARPFYRGRAKGGDENDANTVYALVDEAFEGKRLLDEQVDTTDWQEFSIPAEEDFLGKKKDSENLQQDLFRFKLPPGEFLQPVTKDWGFTSPKKLFLIQDRVAGKSFHRFVENMDAAARFIELALPADEWTIERHDFAALDFVEQVRLASKARIMFGAHGDGLAWGLFMPPASVVMEAVPVRRGGYQVCDEGRNKNLRGIFGGLLKFAENVTHICWMNPQGAANGANITTDVYDWNWRMLNLRLDMMKLAHWLRMALWAVEGTISPDKYSNVQTALVKYYEERGEEPPAEHSS